MLSLEARSVDEAKPPAAPVKRYNTRNRASRPDATSVTPTNLNEDETQESSEVEPSLRGRGEDRDDAPPNARRNRSTSAKSKKEKDLTGGHADITQFLSPK
jgi:hypothetical protein